MLLADYQRRMAELKAIQQPLYISRPKSFEGKIFFIMHVAKKDYPYHGFLENAERTNAMFVRAYSKWYKTFCVQTDTYNAAQTEINYLQTFTRHNPFYIKEEDQLF